jgi:hypothetical protein
MEQAGTTELITSGSLTSVSSKSQPFRFLDLPTEIRREIHRHVLYYKDGRIYFRREGDKAGVQAVKTHADVGVFLICKKIHLEARPFLYSHHKFHVYGNFWRQWEMIGIMRNVNTGLTTRFRSPRIWTQQEWATRAYLRIWSAGKWSRSLRD